MANAAIGLFCEDIREEKQGTDTLVGILPENLLISQKPPAVLSKLALYVRITLESATNIESINIKLRTPEGTVLDLTTFDANLIKKTKQEASESNNPFVGLISKVVFGPFQVAKAGRYEALVELNQEVSVCAFMNVKFVE
jgi:hypothetical protein